MIAPAQQPSFRSGVELVSIDASVIDGSGTPLAGLGAGDFEVTVDGKTRRVVSVQYVDLSPALVPWIRDSWDKSRSAAPGWPGATTEDSGPI